MKTMIEILAVLSGWKFGLDEYGDAILVNSLLSHRK